MRTRSCGCTGSANGDLTEIRTDQLAFTEQETTELFNNAGIPLNQGRHECCGTAPKGGLPGFGWP